MTKKYKINDQEFYRQYSRLVSDFVQFVREQENNRTDVIVTGFLMQIHLKWMYLTMIILMS